MNRRGFISRGLAALAGLAAMPLAKLLPLKYAPSRLHHEDELGLLDPGSWSNAPRRRVLVMTSWWMTYDGKPGSAIYRRSIITDLKPDEMLKDWIFTPRYAHAWRQIQFEELRKGDHFRLIDDPPNPIEDGKSVHIASGDVYAYGGTINRDGKQVSSNSGIATALSYPGKGAGFDWYEVVWGVTPLIVLGEELSRREQLRQIQGFEPRKFPYSFDGGNIPYEAKRG